MNISNKLLCHETIMVAILLFYWCIQVNVSGVSFVDGGFFTMHKVPNTNVFIIIKNNQAVNISFLLLWNHRSKITWTLSRTYLNLIYCIRFWNEDHAYFRKSLELPTAHFMTVSVRVTRPRSTTTVKINFRQKCLYLSQIISLWVGDMTFELTYFRNQFELVH